MLSSLASAPGDSQVPQLVLIGPLGLRIKKFQPRGGFTVFIFLGQVPEDAAQWFSLPYPRGTPKPGSLHYSNYRENVDTVTKGFGDLNHALERNGYNNKREVKKFIEIQFTPT